MNGSILARLLPRSSLTMMLPLAAALAVRLLGVATRPIWYDEAFAVLFSEKGPAAMLRGTLGVNGGAAADIHPLGYYTLLWLWMRAFGESLIGIRLLSIVAGLGVVALIVLLGRELFNPRVGLAGGLVAALAPFQVHYSQEVRMYSWLALWLLVATYCYWRGSQSANRLWWLGLAAAAALAQYTQNLSAFYLMALALWPVLRRDWRSVRWVAVAGLLALVLYLPWLVHLPSQFSKVDQSYWIERPALSRLFTLLLVFVPNTPLLGWELGAGLFAALFVTLIGLMQTSSAVHRGRSGADTAIWLAYLAFAPPLLLFLFSQWKPVYVERALLPSGAMFCLWLAWTLTETPLARPVRILAILLLALGFGIGLYEHVTYAGFPYAPFASLDQYLEKSRQSGDAIIHSNKISMLPAVYYDRGLAQSYVGDPPGTGEDTLAASTQQVLGLMAEPNVQTAAENASRIWFILSERSNQEYIHAGRSGHPDLLWLQQHYSEADMTSWGDLRLYLFTTATGR